GPDRSVGRAHMDDARLTLQRFLERARRSILRQGLESFAAIRLAGREQRRAVRMNDVEDGRHSHRFCLAVGKLQASFADTFSMRTVNVWSAAGADMPPANSSSVASTESLRGVCGIVRPPLIRYGGSLFA